MDPTLHERLPLSSRSIGVLSAIARTHYAVTIDSETEQRWHHAMRAMRVTDSIADDNEQDMRIKNLLDTLISFDDTFPALAAENLGAQRYSVLIRGAATLLRHGEDMRQANTEQEYTKIRIREAHDTATLMSQLATDEVIEQPTYTERFIPTLHRLTVAASLIDTAVDAARDHAIGLLAFSPSAQFRIRLLADGVKELAPYVHIMARPAVARAMGHLCIKALRSERLKRRDN
jgi:hypothetical protein